MNESDKAQIYHLYDVGEMSEAAARELLGDAAFEAAEEKKRSTDAVLDSDTSRFLTQDTEDG